MFNYHHHHHHCLKNLFIEIYAINIKNNDLNVEKFDVLTLKITTHFFFFSIEGTASRKKTRIYCNKLNRIALNDG